MSTEENKAIIRRWVEECYNKGNLAVADELIAPNYVNRSAPLGQAPGLEGEKQYAAMICNSSALSRQWGKVGSKALPEK